MSVPLSLEVRQSTVITVATVHGPLPQDSPCLRLKEAARVAKGGQVRDSGRDKRDPTTIGSHTVN